MLRYYDELVDQIYGYARTDYAFNKTAVFYIVEHIKITSMNFTDKTVNNKIQRKVSMSLMPVVLATQYLQQVQCFLTEYVEEYFRLSGQEGQVHSASGVLLPNADGSFSGAECFFTLASGDVTRYRASVRVGPFAAGFSDRLVAPLQPPKVVAVGSQAFGFDYSAGLQSSADVSFTLLYAGAEPYCKFKAETAGSLTAFASSPARLVGKVAGNMLTNDFMENLSILKYLCRFEWNEVSKRPNKQIYLSVYYDEYTYSDLLYDKYHNQFTGKMEAVLLTPSTKIIDYRVILKNITTSMLEVTLHIKNSETMQGTDSEFSLFT